MAAKDSIRIVDQSAEENSEVIFSENPENGKPKFEMSRPLTPAERKRLSREAQSSEKRMEEKEKDRHRKEKKRAELSKPKKVPKTSAERKRLSRAAQTDKEKIFIKIEKRQNMRALRGKQTGKDHLTQNLAAKKGMKLFKEEGRLMPFSNRLSIPHKDQRLDKNLNEWDWYKRGSQSNADILKIKKPDIVSQLNEKWRSIREKENDEKRKREEAEKKGTWIYNPVYDSYSWSGTEEPIYEDTFCCEAPTEEENAMYEKSREEEVEELLRQKREEAKAKREEQKYERNLPLDALPERPLSEYEKIREQNIKEREAAMAKSGFFTDLLLFKKSIGLIENERI